MQFLIKKKNNKINKILEHEKKYDLLNSEINNLRNELSKCMVELDKIKRISNENLYATIFHDTIKNSGWLNIPLSLSSGAIGYPYAYILYRILDEIKPKKILETGLGQSTKIITEYVKNNAGGGLPTM